MGAEAQAWILKTCNVLDTLPYFVSTIGLTMVGAGEKAFEMKAVRWLGNVVLGLTFENTVFQKCTIALLY